MQGKEETIQYKKLIFQQLQEDEEEEEKERVFCILYIKCRKKRKIVHKLMDNHVVEKLKLAQNIISLGFFLDAFYGFILFIH
uniref:Transmembrane protein n=1 Tax=Glossina palpalis gambiensis TaxID=67801 RepID=A0A1B0B7M6_9MUSC